MKDLCDLFIMPVGYRLVNGFNFARGNDLDVSKLEDFEERQIESSIANNRIELMIAAFKGAIMYGVYEDSWFDIGYERSMLDG